MAANHGLCGGKEGCPLAGGRGRKGMLMMTRLLAILFALLLASPVAEARTITDSAGRIVEIPDHITRVLAAGPPAAVLLYVLAPQEMIGWVKAPRDAEKPYLLPSVRDLPELG